MPPASPAPLDAASTPSPIITGRVWTAAQWIAAWQTKADYNSAVTGGSIDSTPIGATTQSTGAFTTLAANGAVTFTGSGTGLAVTNNATVGGTLGVTGAGAVGGTLTLGTGSTSGQRIQSSGTGNFVLQLGGSSSVWNFTSSAGTSIIQIGGTTNQVTSKQLLAIQTQATGSPVWSGTSIAAMTPLQASLTWSGTSPATGNNCPLMFNLSATTTMDASASQGAVGGNIYLTTGAGYKGPAHALNVQTSQSVTSGGTGNVYTAINAAAQMLANDGGTALVYGSTGGGMTVFNPVAHWGPSATYTGGGSVAEFDIYAEAGSGLLDKIGLLITQINLDRVQGTRDDAAIQIDSQDALTPGWRTILGIGSTRGFDALDPTAGWVLQFLPHDAVGTIGGAGGLDFTSFTPTTSFMRGNGFDLSPSGGWTAATLASTGNTTVGGTLGVTGAGSIGGTFTLGAGGSGNQTINMSGTGNFTMRAGGASSLMTWNSGNTGNPTVMQIQSASNTLWSWRQLNLASIGTNSPVFTGSSRSALVPLQSSLTWTGTGAVAGNNTPLIFSFTSQANLDTGSSGAVGGDITFWLGSGYRGPGAHGLNIKAGTNQATGQTGGALITALNLSAQVLVNDGGTALAIGSTGGSVCAFNPAMYVAAAATYCAGGSISEFNVATEAQVLQKTGLAIIPTSNDAYQGSLEDTALQFGSQGGSAPGWETLIRVGGYQGYSPMHPTNGWIMRFTGHTGVGTIAGAGGLDFTNFVPTTSFMQGNNFALSPAGVWTAASYKVGSNQVVGARDTGWSAMTGTTNEAAVYDTATVTLAQLAGRVMALQAALTTHGLIGT